MTGFVVFLILLTLALAIYYSVVIWWDLRKLDQRPKSNKENFDISSMQEEEQPSSIDEPKRRSLSLRRRNRRMFQKKRNSRLLPRRRLNEPSKNLSRSALTPMSHLTASSLENA